MNVTIEVPDELVYYHFNLINNFKFESFKSWEYNFIKCLEMQLSHLVYKSNLIF